MCPEGSRGVVLCVNTLVCITTLGTLVVINNDEGAHFHPNSAQSIPFNAPLEWCSVHSVHARVGFRVSLRGPNVIKNDIFRNCP